MALIKCPSCAQCFHETTEKFNPNVRPNGSMIRLREPWRSWGWSPFGGEDGRDIKYAESKATLASDMFCPGCGSQLAPSGRLKIVDDPKPSIKTEEETKLDISKKELVATMITEGKHWKEMLKESGMSFKELSATVKEVQGNV